MKKGEGTRREEKVKRGESGRKGTKGKGEEGEGGRSLPPPPQLKFLATLLQG